MSRDAVLLADKLRKKEVITEPISLWDFGQRGEIHLQTNDWLGFWIVRSEVKYSAEGEIVRMQTFCGNHAERRDNSFGDARRAGLSFHTGMLSVAAASRKEVPHIVISASGKILPATTHNCRHRKTLVDMDSTNMDVRDMATDLALADEFIEGVYEQWQEDLAAMEQTYSSGERVSERFR